MVSRQFVSSLPRYIRLNSSDTIISIYGAILDDTLWARSLDAVVGEVDGASAMLMHSEAYDPVPFRINLGSQLWNNVDPEKFAHYQQEYGHYEAAVWETLRDSTAGTVFSDTDFASSALLRQRPDYRFTIENYGLCHRMGMKLNENKAWFDAIAVQFKPEFSTVPVGAPAIISNLHPHIAKAAECSRTFRRLRGRYEAALGALDHVLFGLCVVNQYADIIISNEAANQILEERAGLRRKSDGKIDCMEKREAFFKAVELCATTAAGSGLTSEVMLSVDSPGRGPSILVEVSPLNDPAGEVDRKLNGALVTLIDPSMTDFLDASKVAKAWDLTDAEAFVLSLLVMGDSNGVMADKRNVSIDTIKTQVKSIFSKTNTSKRSDLIRLVARTSPPIR